MGDKGGVKLSYFLAGLGIGTLLGILFAPKSDEETREFLSARAEEGRAYAQKKARELRERAEDLIERSKETASRLASRAAGPQGPGLPPPPYEEEGKKSK